jgi:hypothetical protein
LLIFIYYTPLSLSKKVGLNYEHLIMMDKGQILYSPIGNTTTYLIKCNGVLNHTWNSSYLPGVAVWWLGGGMILRTIRVGVGPGTHGSGGGIQKISWSGTIVWDFRYNSDIVMSHHDVKTLPNGNVLLIAWETKSRAEAVAAGRTLIILQILGYGRITSLKLNQQARQLVILFGSGILGII